VTELVTKYLVERVVEHKEIVHGSRESMSKDRVEYYMMACNALTFGDTDRFDGKGPAVLMIACWVPIMLTKGLFVHITQSRLQRTEKGRAMKQS
jgi:hypothetical protein